MELGAAGMQDLPQLVELLGVLFENEEEFAADAEKQRSALRTILGDTRVGSVFVAREGDRILGMASLLFTVSTAEGGRAALFEDLIVLPERRGKGIATALLRHAIGAARAEGIKRITLLTDRGNKRAQALYRKLGFAASTMTAMRLQLG
jgi:ribosomal protein S18 acetylase RimI-like enzyme